MNRKGASIIVNVIFAILAVTVTFYVLGGFIKPLLNSATKSASYDNFQTLTWKIDSLLQRTNMKKTDSFFLEIEPNFALVAFDKNKEETLGCRRGSTKSLKKPKDCKGEACICLFKKDIDGGVLELDKVVKCQNYKNKDVSFYSLESEGKDVEWFVGCEKTSFPEVYSFEKPLTYEEIVFMEDLSNEIFRTKIYLEMQEKNGVYHILIAKSDEFLEQKKYKFVNICPESSETKCAGKHFDEVIITGNNNLVHCRFDENKNTCVIKTNIEKCENAEIETEFCDCGGTAYHYGFCINDNFFTKIFEDCISISDCEDYNYVQNCAFDSCNTNTPNGCTVKTDKSAFDLFGLFADEKACGSCDTIITCEDYKKNEYACSLDSCGIKKRLPYICYFDTSDKKCKSEIKQQIQVPTETCSKFDFDENSCLQTSEKTYGQTTCIFNYNDNTCKECSTYTKYQDVCKAPGPRLNRCEQFYETFANENEQIINLKKADPCDCDSDQQHPDYDFCTI